MREAQSMHETMHRKCELESLKGRDPLKDQDTDERIILKWN
jgi:hypothetical protein